MSPDGTTTSPAAASGNGAAIAPPGSRSAEQIRADIVARREQLGHSVDTLRGRVTEITDVRSQIRRHRRELILGAAVVTGLAIGAIALRRTLAE